VFCGIFIAEEVDGTGDKESGGTTEADGQTLLEAVLNMFLAFCLFDDAFCLVKRKISSLGTTLKYQLIRIYKLLNVRLKEFCHC